MNKYDKSLTEVWEWKESVYQDVKNLTPQELINKIGRNAETMLEENSVELESIPTTEKHRKIG